MRAIAVIWRKLLAKRVSTVTGVTLCSLATIFGNDLWQTRVAIRSLETGALDPLRFL